MSGNRSGYPDRRKLFGFGMPEYFVLFQQKKQVVFVHNSRQHGSSFGAGMNTGGGSEHKAVLVLHFYAAAAFIPPMRSTLSH